MNLFQRAISVHEQVTRYLRIVMEDFPENKLNERIGSSKTPLEIMNHIIGGQNHIMKKAQNPLSFEPICSDIQSFIEVIDKQQKEYKAKGGVENSAKWLPPNLNNGIPSIAWGIMRACNHSIHHASQLIVYRHIYGLHKVPSINGANWSNIVNLITEFHQS